MNKEKILQALKTKYSNLGLSETAFDGVAELGSKTITEESQIETFVINSESMLKPFVSEIDRRVQKLSQEKNELETKYADLQKTAQTVPSTTIPPVNPDANKALTADDIKSIVEASMKPYAEKITGYETQKTQETLRSEAFLKMKSNPLYKNDVNQKIMDNAFSRLSGEFTNADDMIAKAQEEFDPMISSIGVREDPASPGGGGATDKANQEHAAFIASKFPAAKE